MRAPEEQQDTRIKVKANQHRAHVNASSSEKEDVLSFFKTLLILLVIAGFLRASVVEAFKIPSGSMIPTLLVGDHILVNKLSYGIRLPFMKKMVYEFSSPQRGDVVVFTRPDNPESFEDESKINIIKRIVALPGDTVEVEDKTLIVNNQVVKEAYVQWLDGGHPDGRFGVQTVPEGHVFLLGDNRDRSKDSRFWKPSPFLEISRIKGRAFLIYWSWERLSRIGTLID